MGTYIRHCNMGLAGCQRKAHLAEKTLGGYIRSAATWWREALGIDVPVYQPALPGEKPKLNPFLGDILHQRQAWKEPKQKKEPFTHDMFDALRTFLRDMLAHDASFFLSVEFAVSDWTHLGVLTGSRLGEYGQSKPQRGQLFATIPRCLDAGEWAGMPLAFIRADFSFYDKGLVCHPYKDCLRCSHLAVYVHIRFRFDKSPTNFTIRKFQRMSGSAICAVKRSLSILRRADMLGIPSDYPVGAFRPPGAGAGQFAFLMGCHIKSVMQDACRLAYPDPQHYMRQHIHCIMSHSNRVTAAVALKNAGVPDEDIAFRLRWSLEAVKFYLRDCYKAIGHLTAKAIEGAFLI